MAIPSTQKVAILVQHDDKTYHFETRSIPTPTIGPLELLVRLSVSAVCGSDLHLAAGHMGPTCEILGHEGIGRVVKLGSAVDPATVPIGTRVGLGWVRDVCGECFCCLSSGEEGRCLARLRSGWTVDGTFAEFGVIPARYAIRVPENVPEELVAPLMCGGVTAYKGIKVSQATPGSWMLISGAGGGVGALGVQFARAMGYRVIAVDMDDVERKREYCLGLGAEVYFDAKEVDATKVKNVTGGHGVPTAIVMANTSKAYQAALEFLEPLGTLVCIGILAPEDKVSFLPQIVAGLGVRIIGSAVGSRQDISEAIEFVSRGVVKPVVEMATLDDLTDIAKNFGKKSGKFVLRLSDDVEANRASE